VLRALRAVAFDAAQRQVDRARQVDPMTYGYEYRRYSVFGPQSRSDDLAVIDQRGVAPRLWLGLFILPHQHGLGTAQRGDVREQHEMTNIAEAARMGIAMAVEHHDVGGGLQPLPHLQQGRRLTERKQAGDIRKAHRSYRGGPIGYLQMRQSHKDNPR